MKFFLMLSALVCTLRMDAQGDREYIFEQFKKLGGDWEGFVEYTDEEDNTTKFSLPAKCQTTFDGTRWDYAVQYDHGQGDITGGKGECTVNEDGTKMNYDGVIWNVAALEEHGDTIDIVMETAGKEKRKPTDLRRTITLTSASFYITEEVRQAAPGAIYIVRNKHSFRRPARSKD
jgi:hypothetical protein